MKTLYIILVTISISFFSCGAGKHKITDAEIKALTDLVNNKNFKIEVQWANPQASRAMQQAAQLLPAGNNNASSINLAGDDNFLAISGDIITSYLPFFGERRMGGSYAGNDSTIQFSGTMENYKVIKNKKNGFDISFGAKSNSENFLVNINLFPNLKGDIILNGNTRSIIRYSGEVHSNAK
jgi:hypothetical protein